MIRTEDETRLAEHRQVPRSRSVFVRLPHRRRVSPCDPANEKERRVQLLRGRQIALECEPVGGATEQFAISDVRSAGEMANALRRQGYEPVWKDWDQGIVRA